MKKIMLKSLAIKMIDFNKQKILSINSNQPVIKAQGFRKIL